MDENKNETLLEDEQTRSGKIFFLIFGLILAGSIFATYYRTMIQKNYVVEAQVDCDPFEKACFVWECDPESDVEGEACTGDPEADIWYYNLARRNAKHIPLCDPATDETCTPMICEPGEEDCEEIFCNEENKLEQEAECNDPIEYTKNNPPEEEALDEEECAEDDAECESEAAGDIEEELSTDETIPTSDETATECSPNDMDCLPNQEYITTTDVTTPPAISTE